MNQSVPLVAASLLVMMAGSCTPRVDEVDQAAAREEIMKADRDFAKATQDKGVDGWVGYFADQGAMFPAGKLIRGKEAIRAAMTPALEGGNRLEWEPTEADVSSSGDLGYTIGRYESSAVDSDGNQQSGRGLYVTIWKKQADGAWKVVVDIGSAEETSGSD